MSWSLRIGSIAGTAVRVHITFLLFLAWIFAASYASGGSAAAWSGITFMILLFTYVLLHEFGHILTARAFGVRTPDVTLLPIGGVARLAQIPERASEEFLVAIAGPMVNVAISIALVVLAGAKLDLGPLATVDDTRIPLVDKLAMVNLFLAAFNMIPAFPMDGGRVLRALLASQLGFVRATSVAAIISDDTQITLSFRYAYARRTSTSADQFRIYASSNCGETWSVRSQLFATSDLNTGGVVSGTFVPTSPSQWGYKVLTTINSMFHVSEMRLRFEFFSDGGNNFYLDDINLNGVSVGLEELTGSNGSLLQVMPNPATSQADVLFNLEHTGQVRLELVDPLGRTVQVVHDGNMAHGEQLKNCASSSSIKREKN